MGTALRQDRQDARAEEEENRRRAESELLGHVRIQQQRPSAGSRPLHPPVLVQNWRGQMQKRGQQRRHRVE